MTIETALKKEKLLSHFLGCNTPEKIYEALIVLGKTLKPLAEEDRVTENLVEGCQSQMFLKTRYIDGKMHFEVFSEALISRGLAALLIEFYEGLSPETILQTPPDIIQELGIPSSLTPGRSNGLASLYKKIKQKALFYLLNDRGSESDKKRQ